MYETILDSKTLSRRYTLKKAWLIFKYFACQALVRTILDGKHNETIKLNEVETRLWLLYARSYTKAIDNKKTPRWISNLHFKHLLLCFVLQCCCLKSEGEKKVLVKRSQWGGNNDDTFSVISFKLIEKSSNLQLPFESHRKVNLSKHSPRQRRQSLMKRHWLDILLCQRKRDDDIWESSTRKPIHHYSRLLTW